MISFADARPGTCVADTEYVRLLGYPRGWAMESRALELAEGAREWYGEHGRPWVFAHETAGVVLAAVSAGPEVVAESRKLWREDKPDEAFFLHAFGAAVVERLFGEARTRIAELAQPRGMAVLPGYKGVADARSLLRELSFPFPLEILDSGMLRPELSQLAALRLAPRTEGTPPAAAYVPCGACGFTPCQFRREGTE